MRRLSSRITMLSLTLAALMSAGANSVSADDLFSDNSLGNVFGAPQQQAAPEGSPSFKMIDEPQLAEFIKQSGYETTDLGNSLIGIRVKKDTWEIPIVLSLSQGKTTLWIMAVLITMPENTAPTGEQLIGLMDANRKYGPAHFTYSKAERRITLNRAVPNINLTSDELKKQITMIVDASIETQPLWGNPQTVQSAPQQAPTERAEPAPTPSKKKKAPRSKGPARHVGKFRAQLGPQMTFEMQLNADGSYVVTQSGPNGSETEKGKYTLDGDKLSFVAENGDKTEGEVKFTEKGFDFKLIGKEIALSFTRV